MTRENTENNTADWRSGYEWYLGDSLLRRHGWYNRLQFAIFSSTHGSSSVLARHLQSRQRPWRGTARGRGAGDGERRLCGGQGPSTTWLLSASTTLVKVETPFLVVHRRSSASRRPRRSNSSCSARPTMTYEILTQLPQQCRILSGHTHGRRTRLLLRDKAPK